MQSITKFCAAAALLLVAACNGGAHSDSLDGPAPRKDISSSNAPPAAAATAPPKQSTPGALKFSFVDKYDAGKINSDRSAGTPTGKGALVLGAPFGAGKIKTLTVVQSFRYSYPNVRVAPGDVLSFEAAKALSAGAHVMGIVDVTDANKHTRIYSKSLPPAAAGDLPVWYSAAIPLDRFAGHTVTITFGTELIPALIGRGGATGAWVSFANPGIYGTKHS